MSIKRPLRRKEASDYLFEKHGIVRAVGTLAKLASIGGGPLFQVAGRTPIYTPDNLDVWAESILSPTVANTSELHAFRGSQASHKQAITSTSDNGQEAA